MGDKTVPVGPGTRVSLVFSLELESGEVIDATGNSGAEFTVGDGNLLPGFEKAMFGLKAGAKRRLKIDAESGFGIPNPENIRRMKRSQFQPNMELAEGLMMSFADAQNTELPGVILGVDGDYVEIDFNHPLSGKTLIFDVEVLSVTQVSNEILRVSSS
jgi:FKBP-type peptidyl-prolyl cis-trans isomerase SlpA